MVTKTCNTCNLTLDISEFYKHNRKCKKCLKKSRECRHGVQKHSCPECNPKILCEHGSRKRNCPECNPKLLCEHEKRKYHCHECSPQNFCEHDIRKDSCPECNPKILCKHDIRKWDCPVCSPQNLCKHNIRKRSCPECNPKILCEHKKRKIHCPKCNPKVLCEHDTRKNNCHICSPKKFCIHCKHIRVRKLRYVESLDKKIRCCIGCFYHFYPNDEIPRRYKKKQHYFNEKLIEEFGVNFFLYDKKIKCGCSGKKPDWFIDCFKYSIIIELDEDQHKYESCDEKRMMELFTDLGNRPLVLIRINPDKYKGKTKKRKGCFDFDEKNTLICNEKKFNKRFNILVKMIKYYIDNKPEKEITMEKLFFDRK
jgi:hypothetical protein